MIRPRPNEACGCRSTSRWCLLSASLGRLRALLPEVEHRVYKVHVGVYRLLGELLAGLGSALLLIGQLLAHLPSALCLGTQVLDRPVKEVLRKPGVLLLGIDATL
jgi:hypothetical protein